MQGHSLWSLFISYDSRFSWSRNPCLSFLFNLWLWLLFFFFFHSKTIDNHSFIFILLLFFSIICLIFPHWLFQFFFYFLSGKIIEITSSLLLLCIFIPSRHTSMAFLCLKGKHTRTHTHTHMKNLSILLWNIMCGYHHLADTWLRGYFFCLQPWYHLFPAPQCFMICISILNNNFIDFHSSS